MIDEISTALAIASIFVGIIATWLVTRHYYKKDRLEMTKSLEQLADKLTQNMVDTENAGLRVGEKGGRVKYRNNQTIGADQLRSIDENVNIGESVGAVVGHKDGTKTVVSEHQVSHSTDSYLVPSDKKIVSEHTKSFSADAILVHQEENEAKNKKVNKHEKKNADDITDDSE